MTTTVDIARITADPAAWPRAELDPERVADFADLYRDGGPMALPAIAVIDRGDDYLLADGWHRLEALRQLRAETAAADLLTTGGRDAVQFAYETGLRTSATASRPLTRAEKQEAVRRLDQAGGRTDQEIAAIVGVARTTVARIRGRGGAPQSGAEPVSSRRPSTANELAARLVRDIDRIWEGRGITDAVLDRLPRNLAAALLDRFEPEEALTWARRMAAWTADAARRLEQELES